MFLVDEFISHNERKKTVFKGGGFRSLLLKIHHALNQISHLSVVEDINIATTSDFDPPPEIT